jgi:hypothetical protein
MIDRSNSAKTPIIPNSGLGYWRGRVDALLLQAKVDLESVKLRQEANQVMQRAAEPIHRPCHDEIELAATCVLPKLVKGRPLVAPAGALGKVASSLCQWPFS